MAAVVVAWRRSRRYWHALGRPEIFNTDQGSQFNSATFTGTLAGARIRISMDGRGRCSRSGYGARSNTRTSISGTMPTASRPSGIAFWITFYSSRRPHQALHADGGLARRRHRRAQQHGCGHGGQRKSFAHMPTAATTAADGTHRSMISGGRSSRVSN